MYFDRQLSQLVATGARLFLLRPVNTHHAVHYLQRYYHLVGQLHIRQIQNQILLPLKQIIIVLVFSGYTGC